MPVLKSISIELEVEGDPTSLFVLKIDGAVFAEHLTAAQTHLLVGDVLEQIVLPNAPDKFDTVRKRRAEILPARISQLRKVLQRD
jgi:hypothetical protein